MTNSEIAPNTITNQPKKRRLGRKILFGLITAVILLVGQEVAFRAIFPIPESNRFNRIWYQMMAETHPDFRPLLKRGLVYDSLVFESVPDGWKHVHRLNRFGFREKDFSIEPVPGKKRIVLVGDSVTEGQGAAADETIAANLGRDLGERFEVLNLGVVAAMMVQISQLACDSVAVLLPEVLVVVLYANDTPTPPILPSVTSLEFLVKGVENDAEDAKRESRLPRSVALGIRLAKNEPIYKRYFGKPFRYFAPIPDPANPFTDRTAPVPGLKPELEAAMRAGQLNPWLVLQSEQLPEMISADFAMGGSPEQQLWIMREVCNRVKTRLVIAYVPFHATVHPRYAQALKDLTAPAELADSLATDPVYSRQAKQLAVICEQLELTFVDTTGALKAAENAGKPQYWPYDSHPRPEGYATIAKAIGEVLKDK
jgi:lysophospholipase L1-like esterase